MPFKRFVETGRVAYVADGPDKGKLCAIVDVINQTKALIDGPETGVSRGQIRLNQIHLTKFRIKFPYTASTRVVRKAWKDNKVDERWKESAWSKKVEAKKKRADLTDFDRFKLIHARKVRNAARTKLFYKLRAGRKKELRERRYARKTGKDVKKDTKKKAPAKKPEGKK
ncbi:ribosomal protein L14 [Lycorma delicatula]|uniref:ribosomal protein L14 n=1 Tax=Lycorma delicatula TaxID=130591 RepID=UPI003F516DDE